MFKLGMEAEIFYSADASVAVLLFQSVPPVRGATWEDQPHPCGATVSIRAPRAGSDLHNGACRSACQSFNPRPPCGKRLSLSVCRQQR